MRLTQTEVSPQEVDFLMQMDSAYVRQMNQELSEMHDRMRDKHKAKP